MSFKALALLLQVHSDGVAGGCKQGGLPVKLLPHSKTKSAEVGLDQDHFIMLQELLNSWQ